jgi:protein-S-isoprenylcysteine O-methyltransferase Ste14
MGCFAASVFTSVLWRSNLNPELLRVLWYVGIGLQAAGVVTLILAYGSMARGKTTINPSEHTMKVVTSGIYAYSRNPIYIGWFLFIAGMGIRKASWLVLAIAVAMIVLLVWAVILEEEKYLESRFGEEYLRYKRSVRRWL